MTATVTEREQIFPRFLDLLARSRLRPAVGSKGLRIEIRGGVGNEFALPPILWHINNYEGGCNVCLVKSLSGIIDFVRLE